MCDGVWLGVAVAVGDCEGDCVGVTNWLGVTLFVGLRDGDCVSVGDTLADWLELSLAVGDCEADWLGLCEGVPDDDPDKLLVTLEVCEAVLVLELVPEGVRADDSV